jgi:hypothetical protein
MANFSELSVEELCQSILDNPREIGKQFHPNMPIQTRSLMSNHSVEIHGISFNNIQKILTNIFQSIECVKYDFDSNNFMWSIEYGTQLPYNYRIHYHNDKAVSAFQSAIKARDMFPHLNNDITFPNQNNRTWSVTNIYLYANPNNNSIILEFNKLSGDPHSFFSIIKDIRDWFGTPENILWYQREAYISLFEGINEPSNIESKYICNEDTMKEVLSYMCWPSI